MRYKHLFNASFAALFAGILLPGLQAEAVAKKVPVTIHAVEKDVPYDNKGSTYHAWTFGGTVPGPVVRVTEGDIIEFTLINDEGNKNSHSMDFHAARVDVVTDFDSVKPGETKKFTFPADKPGVFFYHCGSDPMIQHIARGMYGVIIVDPKDEFAFPKPDREYVLIQAEHYENPDDKTAMMRNKWANVVFNGGIFKYSPVHDAEATRWLQAKPGERVRIYFVNAGPNEFSSLHPIAGMWDKVFPSGSPKNVLHNMQSYTVGPGDAAALDLISPVEGANAIVDHAMHHALSGAIAVIMFSDDADPEMGRGDNILIR